jgi:hypothetical protein
VGAGFSVPVQNRPGAYLATCIMGTGSFPGVKRPGLSVDHPPPSSAEVKERVELYLYSPSGPFMACSRVNFTCTFTVTCLYTIVSNYSAVVGIYVESLCPIDQCKPTLKSLLLLTLWTFNTTSVFDKSSGGQI